MRIDGWPTCRVCSKPVDRVEVVPSFESGAVTVRVICHGKFQVDQLNRFTIENADEIRLHEAFVEQAERGEGRIA